MSERIVGADYGSDRNGLIWAYRFAPGARASEIESDLAAGWLRDVSLAAPGEFLWLHFSLTNTATEPWIRTNLELPDAFHGALREAVSSTRLEQEGEHLVAVLHDLLFDFRFDPADLSTVVLCIGPRYLVSARLRPLRSVDQLRADVRSGQPVRSPAELLAGLMLDQAHVLVDIVRSTTARVDQIEDLLLKGRAASSRQELGTLRRLLVRIQRLLAPEPAALFRLLNRPPAWLDEDDVVDLRQAAEEMSAAVVDSSSLVERIKILQEELVALVTERTNRTLFILTFVTVLALPINLVAGLFGMNLGGIPFAESRHGFATVVALLISATTLLAIVAIRRSRD